MDEFSKYEIHREDEKDEAETGGRMCGVEKYYFHYILISDHVSIKLKHKQTILFYSSPKDIYYTLWHRS